MELFRGQLSVSVCLCRLSGAMCLFGLLISLTACPLRPEQPSSQQLASLPAARLGKPAHRGVNLTGYNMTLQVKLDLEVGSIVEHASC